METLLSESANKQKLYSVNNKRNVWIPSFTEMYYKYNEQMNPICCK